MYEALLHIGFKSYTVDKHILGKAVVDFSRKILDKAFESIKDKNIQIIHIRYCENIKNPK